MFKYVSDISLLSHYIVDNFITDKNIALDATLGNGHDTNFLALNFKKVYAFEIQSEPCIQYNKIKKCNTVVINDSHHNFEKYIIENVNCLMYNLGFLPGGDKGITTLTETTIQSIQNGLKILAHGGIMTIAVYIGHSEGEKEKNCILKYVETLHKNEFGVMEHKYLNRSKTSPMLIVIEKK